MTIDNSPSAPKIIVQRTWVSHKAPCNHFWQRTVACSLCLKTNLVASILYNLAKSYQMYPVLTDVTIFHNMTPDLTGFLRQLVLNPHHISPTHPALAFKTDQDDEGM